jgi:type VI secretion system secreted protein VgrG
VGIETDRHLELHCSLGPDKLLVRHFGGTEQLGRCFEYTLTLYSTDHDVKMESLLGQHASVRIRVASSERFFDGIVCSFSHSGAAGRYALYRMTLWPWLWLLSTNQDCRVFQDESTVDIVKKIIGERGLGPIEENLMGSYQPREYCVQYRESELTFLSRLMEEEGIYYYFKHEKNKHTLVLADSSSAHQPAPGFEEISYGRLEDDNGEPGVFFDWTSTKRIQSGKATLTDYDFEKPQADMQAGSSDPKSHAHASGECFDYPGRYKVIKQGEDRTRVRIEEAMVGYELADGATDALGIFTGCLVTLKDHPRGDQNKQYLMVGISYDIDSGQFESGSGGGGELVFSARTKALDAKVPFRTTRSTSHPIIAGAQTATVVGPSDQEIWTDEYGRVKVQFHWDRDGKRDENSSCWIRVAQSWAGARWGSIFIPRIGQEVVVEFLEGDPDQPLITGSVYNNRNKPPYKLPAHMTQSGIKTQSTKGGTAQDYNELRFEDEKGKEEIHLQAQKDFTSEVENDSTHKIKNKLAVTVEESDYTIDVLKGQMITKVPKDLYEVSAKEILIHVGENKIHIDNMGITLKVGGSEINLTAMLIKVNAGTIKLN